MNRTANWKIELCIEREQSLELTTFAFGLGSLSTMYSNMAKKDKSAKLTIDHVRRGSIVISLVTTSLASATPLLTDRNNFEMFYYALSTIMKSAASAAPDSLQELEKTLLMINEEYRILGDSFNVRPLINLTNLIGVKGEKFEISLFKNTHVNNYFTINGEESVRARNNLRAISHEDSHIRDKQLFAWVQTRHDGRKKGDKALIENIHLDPLPVVFDSDMIKHAMTTGANWQDKIYSVDVEVQLIDGLPKRYKVINYYPEEDI